MPDAYFTAGECVADHYEISHLLGAGATSQVFMARDSRTGQDVVIKALHPHLKAAPESREQFRRELAASAQIGGGGVARCYELLDTEDTSCLVMEYVAGEELGYYLYRHGVMRVAETVDLACNLLEIVGRCHEEGIIHRDLKPANILIDEELRPTLLDFGVSRLTSETEQGQAARMLGTPQYMAPELFLGRSVDLRCDIYALGVVLFECLAGHPPFSADTLPELARFHLEGEIPPLARDTDPVPDWLAAVIRKCLAKEPSERYLSCMAVADDLRARKILLEGTEYAGVGRCPQCRRAVISKLPFCAGCGLWFHDALKKGRFDLVVTHVLDHGRALVSLDDTYAGCLRSQAGELLAGVRPLLLHGVDDGTARLVLTSVRHMGISGELERSASPLARLKTLAAFTGLLVFMALLFRSVTRAVARLHSGAGGVLQIMGPSVIILSSAVEWVILGFFILLMARLLIRLRSTPILSLSGLRNISGAGDHQSGQLLSISRLLGRSLPGELRDLFYLLFRRLDQVQRLKRTSGFVSADTAPLLQAAEKLGEAIGLLGEKLVADGLPTASSEALSLTRERLLNRFVLLVGTLNRLLGQEITVQSDLWQALHQRADELGHETEVDLAATVAAVRELSGAVPLE